MKLKKKKKRSCAANRAEQKDTIGKNKRCLEAAAAGNF